uniref:Putative G-protein coupled receptor n=1 Tax=Spisula solidissima TaxID=6584 RepID=Q8MTW6_SPISO|nr:putative G-protein coupled receptor [Spisula solidissima]
MYMEDSELKSMINNLTGLNESVVGNETTPKVEYLLIAIKSTAMLLIMLGAIFGNILVVTAVMKFERLRSAITNYFIVSLAFADFLVSILVMPFNASIAISGKWMFGRTMCDVFNSNDVLFSTASILHLCCISMDRYIAIIHPFKYQSKMTHFRVYVMIAITWISSILISYIPIQSHWYTTSDTLKVMAERPDDCLFIVNKAYAVVSSSISFWIPCTIMVFVYLKIYMEARRQEKQIKQSGYHIKELSPSEQTNLTDDQSENRNERKRMRREHKAAKTLGIIMGAFVFCFLPFFTWYLVTTLCGDACPYPEMVGAACFWLGYFNSCLNPIIYAYFNRDFRGAFRKLLRLNKTFGGGGDGYSDHSGFENREHCVQVHSKHPCRNGNKSNV